MQKFSLPISAMENARKKPVVLNKIQLVLLCLGFSVAIGCIPFIPPSLGLSTGWMKLVQILLFFMAGIIYATKFTEPGSDAGANENDNLFFTFRVCLFIFLALLVLYFLLRPQLLLLALGSACAFALPYVIISSWQAFTTFSHIEHGVWAKPVPDIREKTFIFFGGLALKIKFSLKANDSKKKIYRSHAPLDKSLGDFFNHFVLIQRNNNKLPVELLDEEQKPFGWKFYKVAFGGLVKKQLDPNVSLEAQDLKNHSVILVERVRLSETGDALKPETNFNY